jgi:hypothetical protein
MSKRSHELSAEHGALVSRVFDFAKTHGHAHPYASDRALAREIRGLAPALPAMGATHHREKQRRLPIMKECGQTGQGQMGDYDYLQIFTHSQSPPTCAMRPIRVEGGRS